MFLNLKRINISTVRWKEEQTQLYQAFSIIKKKPEQMLL